MFGFSRCSCFEDHAEGVWNVELLQPQPGPAGGLPQENAHPVMNLLATSSPWESSPCVAATVGRSALVAPCRAIAAPAPKHDIQNARAVLPPPGCEQRVGLSLGVMSSPHLAIVISLKGQIGGPKRPAGPQGKQC